MVQPSAPLPETTQITTALRLGWHFTELRGRHDVQVFRQPRPAIVAQPSLCLGDERTPDEQAAEVAAVVAAAAAKLVVVAATDRAYDFATARVRPSTDTRPAATVPTPPAATVPEPAPQAPTAAAPAQAEPSPVGAAREG